MRKIIFTLFAAGFTNLVSAAVPPLKTQIVASGFDRPLFATAPNGDPRLFVVEQGGLVKVMQNGAVLPTPFLDLSAKVDTTGERGLLGLAFDPGFETNRRFYVDYIDKTTLNTVVATYQASASQPNIADTFNAQTVFTVAQPEFTNHKAGWIGFRPGEDTNLYIATGMAGLPTIPIIERKILMKISARFYGSMYRLIIFLPTTLGMAMASRPGT